MTTAKPAAPRAVRAARKHQRTALAIVASEAATPHAIAEHCTLALSLIDGAGALLDHIITEYEETASVPQQIEIERARRALGAARTYAFNARNQVDELRDDSRERFVKLDPMGELPDFDAFFDAEAQLAVVQAFIAGSDAYETEERMLPAEQLAALALARLERARNALDDALAARRSAA